MDRHRHYRHTGQTLAEYGLLIAFIAIVALGGLSVLAVQMDDTVTASGTHMSGGFFSPTVTGGGGVSGCTGSGGSQEGGSSGFKGTNKNAPASFGPEPNAPVGGC